jgi:hypothetical protein
MTTEEYLEIEQMKSEIIAKLILGGIAPERARNCIETFLDLVEERPGFCDQLLEKIQRRH